MHNAATPIRVIVVDDHPMLREGTQALLARSPGIAVVGTTGTGAEALRLVAALRPDVVVLDVHLPDMSGIEITREIRANYPEIAILILTGYDDAGYVRALVPLGVQGYLRKTATGEEIVAGVQAVAQGRLALAADLLQLGMGGGGLELTDRERAVLWLLASGRRNKEIAEAIGISVKTVEFHVSRVLEKLGARSRTEAIRAAFQQGLVDLDTSRKADPS